jgi:adenylate cyclase
VRLACQLRPNGPVEVTPLLPTLTPAREALRHPIEALGEERQIAVLFADIRDFTRVSEPRLPYDVVFLLNRYCRVMGEAIEAAGGRVDKFTGDGLMALFGLKAAGPDACRQALAAARHMSTQLAALNEALASDLQAPLAMGVGIHFGSTIVGHIGQGEWRSLTAVGDTVNTASRLETLCKEYNCELVVSDNLLARAGIELKDPKPLAVEIRGRAAPLTIHTFGSARDFEAAVDEKGEGLC